MSYNKHNQVANPSLVPVIKDLEKMFELANKKFFGGSLPPVVIVTSKDTMSAYGWYTCAEVWKATDGETEKSFHEICITPENLTRGLVPTWATMIHEMCHHYNFMNGIKDTSNRGVYHNQKFKETAEKAGLVIEKVEKYGYSKTSVSEETEKWMLSCEKSMLQDFNLHREEAVKPKKVRQKSHSIKYVCPTCGTSCRSTKAIRIACMECDCEMEVEF